VDRQAPESLGPPLDAAVQLLVGSDLHSSRPGLEWFCHLAELHEPDAVVFLGDFITRQPLSFTREVLATLRQLAPACFVIPGNMDPRETVVELDIAATDGLVNLHKHAVSLRGYRFAGLGGSITTPLGDTPFEAADAAFAEPLRAVLPADVWVLHSPLRGFRDRAGPGIAAGSASLRALWEEQNPRPRLVLSGHIHEATGQEVSGGTTFLNPGSLANRSAARAVLHAGGVHAEVLGG